MHFGTLCTELQWMFLFLFRLFLMKKVKIEQKENTFIFSGYPRSVSYQSTDCCVSIFIVLYVGETMKIVM